ncbi:hypothetical protein Nepgr_003874 [Nepenthes gracilis]|uniref:Uncharacterized protein n=1 Tax=Nepenthes gracilis TaxID=150966 RepID=A0AAD3S0C2_NEPGR|nr:hypothetical protein Nepgr_003874 [Nepenthes gracilis]
MLKAWQLFLALLVQGVFADVGNFCWCWGWTMLQLPECGWLVEFVALNPVDGGFEVDGGDEMLSIDWHELPGAQEQHFETMLESIVVLLQFAFPGADGKILEAPLPDWIRRFPLGSLRKIGSDTLRKPILVEDLYNSFAILQSNDDTKPSALAKVSGQEDTTSVIANATCTLETPKHSPNMLTGIVGKKLTSSHFDTLGPNHYMDAAPPGSPQQLLDHSDLVSSFTGMIVTARWEQ